MPRYNQERKVDVSRLTPCSYNYAHKKVFRARGKAVDYDCELCGGAATQWSYTRGDAWEQSGNRTDAKGYTYRMFWSPNVWAYQPLCVSCHSEKDKHNGGDS